jgi:adenylyltransferase/sulfurtransferase
VEELHQDQRRLLQEGLNDRAARFSRQTRFAPLGESGQQRLQHSTVAIVGIGALGTHLADALVRAGVGTLWLVDRDVVEWHNLPRQVLFDESDAEQGRPKAVAAAAKLQRIDRACALHAVADEFTPATLDDLRATPDLLLDGTDNFATRYVLNDLALQRGIPWIYGAALGSEGMAMAVLPGRTPCLRCILPAPPSNDAGTCETEGILAPVIAMVTAFQAAQALKILSGQLDAVARGVFVADVWRNRYELQLGNAQPVPECASCGTRTFPALAATGAGAISLCGRDAVQINASTTSVFDFAAWLTRLRAAGVVCADTPHLVRFVADGARFSVFPDGRALVFGAGDTKRAAALYDRWVGAR